MPGGGPSAASSLYSGIFSADAGGSTSSNEKGKEESPEQVKGTTELSTSSTSNESVAAAKPQAWSAALRFAPRKNINTQANKSRRPPVSALISSGFSVAPVSGEEEATAVKSDQSPPDVPVASSSKGWSPMIKSEPNSKERVKTDALRSNIITNDAIISLPKITAPPELSISVEEFEKDKALFAALAEKRGEKKSMHQWGPDWQEDAEDEDINGFGDTKEGRKAKKKKYKRKRDASPGHMGGQAASLRMDADYDARVPNDYNEFKLLVRSRREAVKQVARAREAEEALKGSRGYVGKLGDDYGSESEEDDSYYRRNKMGGFAPPAIYRQPNIVTQPGSTSPFNDDDEKPYLSPPLLAISDRASAPVTSLSGEDAYQRRLAMSQSQAPSASLSEASKPDTQSAPPIHDLAAKAALAASIAARLAKAAPSQEAPPPKPALPSFISSTIFPPNSASFAEKLMEKQGWKKGEALGAEGNKGLLDPILAEKVEAERRKQVRSSDRPLQSNRGTIINTREDGKRKEEREKFGTPSEIILLENMVDLADIDDDLTGEIGEECSKHGYVQRVFIWPNGPEGVRIFVRFSGMAGAWRCVKELEGRFFGGKTVRARYYPLIDFERGDYMKNVQ